MGVADEVGSILLAEQGPFGSERGHASLSIIVSSVENVTPVCQNVHNVSDFFSFGNLL